MVLLLPCALYVHHNSLQAGESARFWVGHRRYLHLLIGPTQAASPWPIVFRCPSFPCGCQALARAQLIRQLGRLH